MSPLELPLAVAALLLAVCIGTIVHELLHAGVLRAAGVPAEVQWLPDGRPGRLGGGLVGTWASVRLREIPDGLPAWHLRAASLAPLALAIPLLAIPLGLVPDPFAAEAPLAQAAVIGWLACALPSPADFSMAWDADRLVEEPGPVTGRTVTDSGSGR